ncbi:hypothetical protein EV368DRAFT_63573 [Lentinula lateritia]|nr:hypothetical protein EV368DRAFT_63573 [Lentinula lateritia]
MSLGQILNNSPGKPVDFLLGQYRDASWITPTTTPMPSSDGFKFNASSYDNVDDLTMHVIENIQSEEAKYSLPDLQRHIYHHSKMITLQIELDSLRRIIFGYKKATTLDITYSTRPFPKRENTIYDSVSPGGLNHKLQHITKPLPTFSTKQLLIEHKTFLWEAQATDKCRLWLRNIVHNIIAIDSVRLWGFLDEIEIFTYCEAVSKCLYASQFTAIVTNESSTIKGGAKSQQQLVLQCIQNLSAVVLFLINFTKSLEQSPYPIASFSTHPPMRAIPSVIQTLEKTPVESTKYWRRRKFVTRLLNMVAFPSTRNYVKDFFNHTVPPDIEEEEDSEEEEEEEEHEEDSEDEEEEEEEEQLESYNIAPLTANTEPDARQTFSAGLQALHHKAESLLQWIIAMGQYDSEEDPDDLMDEQLAAQKALILKVIRNPGPLRFCLQDFRTMVAAAGYKGKVEAQERQAIIRMICGYKLYLTHIMQNELAEHYFQTKSIPKWTSSATNIDNIQALEDRALARDIFILKDTQNNNMHIWIKCVLRNIQALQLVQEWDTLSPEVQGRF